MRVLKLAVMGVVMVAMLGIGVDGGQLGFGSPAYARHRHHRHHAKHHKHGRKRRAKHRATAEF